MTAILQPPFQFQQQNFKYFRWHGQTQHNTTQINNATANWHIVHATLNPFCRPHFALS